MKKKAKKKATVHKRKSGYAFPVCGQFYVKEKNTRTTWRGVTCKNCLRSKKAGKK